MATNILLVEDEQLLRESYQIILEAEAFAVDTASNGLEALERFKAKAYDLVLLDIMMPVLDGIGFLEQLPDKQQVPRPIIIILSNLSGGDEINRALELGASKYFQKSQLDPAGLITLLRNELAIA